MTVSPLSVYLIADLLHPVGKITGAGILAVEQREETLRSRQQPGHLRPRAIGLPGADAGQSRLRRLRVRRRPPR